MEFHFNSYEVNKNKNNNNLLFISTNHIDENKCVYYIILNSIWETIEEKKMSVFEIWKQKQKYSFSHIKTSPHSCHRHWINPNRKKKNVVVEKEWRKACIWTREARISITLVQSLSFLLSFYLERKKKNKKLLSFCFSVHLIINGNNDRFSVVLSFDFIIIIFFCVLISHQFSKWMNWWLTCLLMKHKDEEKAKPAGFHAPACYLKFF